MGAYLSLGNCTNNYAEYMGLILAQILVSLGGVTMVSFRTDSELLTKQVKGAYKVKNAVL